MDLTEQQRRVEALPTKEAPFPKNKPAGKMPSNFAPSWITGQRGSISGKGLGRVISIENLYARALSHSQQIRVFSDLPLIRETGIQEAKGAFDTVAFLEGKFGHTNDPVGNTLTTGGAPRFLQDEWGAEGGLRKKLITGTEVTISQGVGHLDNNSIYFDPNPQSTGRLSLTIVQPLLRGAGVRYNRSIIHIARLDSQAAMSEFVRQSESHLLEITRSYWALYAARVMYLQKADLVETTGKVVEEIRARQEVDARKTQLFRAESALVDRRSDLERAEAAVRNAQDRLATLTGDPELLDNPLGELIPADRLVLSSSPTDAQAAARSALQNRPEITQAFLQLQAANIRQDMARNEILPQLNLVLQGYLSGLSENDIGSAYGRQYTEGGPGYSAGIVFSMPLENNIGKAQLERRRLEVRQQTSQVKSAIDTVILEVRISAREVGTAYRETHAKYEAVRAFTEDLATLEARRAVQDLKDEGQVASYLDTMLDAQDRRSRAEEEFIRAAANYQIAIVNLQRAKGQLLNYSEISVVRERDPQTNLPQLNLVKRPKDGKAVAPVGAAK